MSSLTRFLISALGVLGTAGLGIGVGVGLVLARKA